MTAGRYAVYYMPAADTALWRAGSAWLGRDAATNRAVPQPTTAGIDPAELAARTATPRRYGFHATLKAPFRLAAAARRNDLEAAVASLAAASPAFALGLQVGCLRDFVALLPNEPGADQAGQLARGCVTALDRFRAPPTPAEYAHRKPERLPPRERALLDRWGYPYVLEAFRFHITLSGRLSGRALAGTRVAAESWFAPLLREPLRVDAITLCHQAQPDDPFIVLGRYPLGTSPL